MKTFKLVLISIFIVNNLTAQLWIQSTSPTTADLEQVIYVDSTHLIAGGDNGVLIESADGGINWTLASVNLIEDVEGLYNFGTYVLAVSEKGIAVKSNGSWTLKTVNPGINARGGHFSDSLNGYLVGEYGPVMRTTNGGSTWTSQSIASANRLEDILFLGSSKGIVVGRGGTMFQSANAGGTWSRRSGFTNDLKNIESNTSGHVYLVGENTSFFESKDSCQSWNAISTGIAGDYSSIYAIGNNFLIAGEAGVVIQSTDGGVSWTNELILSPIDFNACSIFPGSSAVVVGDAGTIYVKRSGIPSALPPESSLSHKFNYGINRNATFNTVRVQTYQLCSIELYSIDGRLIAQSYSKESHTLETAAFAMYLLKVELNNGEVFWKKIG